MAESGLVFKQRNSLGLEVAIKLIDGRELQVVSKSKKARQAYSVDVLSLQDKSKKIFCISWKWLLSSIAFVLLSLLMLKVLPPYLDENKNIYLAAILFTGLVGGIYCFIQFWKLTSRKQIFYSKNALVPIIELTVGKPTKESFSSFIETIEKRIKKFRGHMDIAEDKQLIGEMKMLRRLSSEGVISQKSYEMAKAKLFNGFDSKAINRND